jgi:hypothetical protein
LQKLNARPDHALACLCFHAIRRFVAKPKAFLNFWNVRGARVRDADNLRATVASI